MTCELFALSFDATDPERLGRFWAGVLGWETTGDRDPDGVALLPSDDTGFGLRFLPSQDVKVGANRMHFDLTSTRRSSRRRSPARSISAAGISTSGSSRRRDTSYSPTPRSTSSA